MKVALVYDRINKIGGAERVLLALHEIFPDAPLFTAVYDKKNASWADVFKIHSSFLQKVPFFRNHHEYIPFLMPFAFESFSFEGFDVVISITSAEAKGVITKPETVHICYCLTPTRYLWSHYDAYFKNPLVKKLSYPVVSMMQEWDQVASKRVDYYIAISQTVQKRISQFYTRDASVLYPPVDDSLFHIANRTREPFYLVVSRLVGYKRIDMVVDVFNQLKKPLVIIGQGSEKNILMKKAHKNITFIDFLTDSPLVTYYQTCRALICPQEEDFGLVAVEAQLCGAPVIAYGKGGFSETIKDGVTGVLFQNQTTKSLHRAIELFEKNTYSEKDCYNRALQFSKERFKKEFSSFVHAQYKGFANRVDSFVKPAL